MAKKEEGRGAASEQVDASAIPQTSTEKPSTEELAKSGYRVPEHFEVLEEAEGDPEVAARLAAERAPATTQDEVNAEADATQREAMERQGREYHIPGQPVSGKKSGGPAENKAAAAEDEPKKGAKGSKK